jgi:NADH-quinone oxidoreductase subunit C
LTDAPPDSESGDSPTTAARAPDEEYVSGLAERLGAASWVVEHETARVYVDRDDWSETLRRARDEEHLVFFSWLSAIDWARETAVGEGVEDPDDLDERFEVICRLSSVEGAEAAHFIARLPKDDPVIESIVPLFGGASWHEREAHEMFGIDFRGHPNLTKLYLPDAFEGHPLRKSFALLTRELKPWPGTVDVEDMPSLDNPEAGDGQS